MRRTLFTIIAVVATIMAATAQSPFAGWWRGQLAMLPIVFHIEETAPGNLSGNLYSPAQTAEPIPLTTVRAHTDTLTVEVAGIGLRYTGTISGTPRKIDGTLTQGGNKFSIALLPATEDDAKVYRPQTPQPPFLYNSDDITFRNGTLTLAGTLTYPWSGTPAGAVVLVSGSGAHNRDEEIMGHKPFAVIADFLTHCGWAVLRPRMRRLRCRLAPRYHPRLRHRRSRGTALPARSRHAAPPPHRHTRTQRRGSHSHD